MHDFLTAINGTGTTLIAMLIAVFLGIWLNNRGLDKLELKVDKLEGKMDARFGAIDARFNRLEEKLDGDLRAVFVAQALQDYRLQLLEKAAQPITR